MAAWTTLTAMVGNVMAGALALATAACAAGTEPDPQALDLGSPVDPGGAGGAGLAATGGFDPGVAGGGGIEACAGVEQEATRVGVRMFIAVDKSGSMASDGKWWAAQGAFTAFFTDPEADALEVALRFWPSGSCNELSCSIDGCATPAVALGSLGDPTHEQALVSAFVATSPVGMTPMSAALGGACQWAAEQQADGAGGDKVVVVLLTDGEPTACDTGIGTIAGHAAAAYAEAGVLTFAVGLAGSNEAHMNLIAQAGQTGQGFFIGNGNAEAELLAALEAIRQTVVACTFAMPDSGDPEHPVDPELVNVSYTPGGGQPETLEQVPDETHCAASGGWHYDDPAEPTAIVLCERTCQQVQADDAARIEIVLGCSTVTR